MKIVNIERVGKRKVYDIETETNSYLLHNGIISHNSGMVYSASQILTLSKAQDKDADGSVNGVIITVTNSKARLTKEKLKVKCLVSFDSGLDRYYWLTELAEAAGIFKKVSTKYQLPDGKSYFGKTIKENPEKFFTKEILDQIDEWVQRNFTYGGSGDESVINAAFEDE